MPKGGELKTNSTDDTDDTDGTDGIESTDSKVFLPVYSLPRGIAGLVLAVWATDSRRAACLAAKVERHLRSEQWALGLHALVCGLPPAPAPAPAPRH